MTTLAVLCLAAAGCTSSDAKDPTPTAGAQSTSPASGAQKTVLEFAVYGTDDEVEPYVAMAAAFTRSNPNTTVSVQRAPDAAAAMVNLSNGFDRDDPPDVFLMRHEDLPTLLADERVQPVDQLLEDREVDFGDGFQRDGLEAFSGDSALQCMPHDVSPLVVYYNTRLLDLRSLAEIDEEPPAAEDGWSWEEFTQAARQMSRGRTKGVYIEPSLEQLAPLVRSGGGDIVDDVAAPSTLTLADGDSPAALEQVLTLARDPNVTPTQTELGRQTAVELFEHGRLGMILGTRELTPGLRAAKDLDFEVMPLPSLGRYRTITSMTGYCISSGTDEVEAAADFLAFAVGNEGAAITSTGGYVVPSNLQVANSPAFTQPALEPVNSFVFTEGVRRADPMPLVSQWHRVGQEVRPFLAEMFYSPVIELDTLLKEIDVVSQPILADEEASPQGRDPGP